MKKKILSIAKDFSNVPGGRRRRDGPYSAEEFRDDVLAPALRRAIDASVQLEVLLDDTEGYGSSFLEETFGGLVRTKKFDPDVLRRYLAITSQNPLYEGYRRLAVRYMEDALAKVAA